MIRDGSYSGALLSTCTTIAGEAPKAKRFMSGISFDVGYTV